MSTRQAQAVIRDPDLLPGRYRLDPVSTTISFTARKFGMFVITGSMHLTTGTIIVGDTLDCSAVQAVLSAESFHTPMAKRDRHVKSKKLLDIVAFPTFGFRSTQVYRAEDKWRIDGDLTVHGQTAPVTLVVESASTQDDLLKVCATTQVNRRDFGVTAMKIAASASVDVRIEALAIPVRSR